VLGADSRTSTGAYVANRVSNKLTMVSDRIYCCRSGSAADTQAISDMVRMYVGMHALDIGQDPDVFTAAKIFQQICYNNKDRLQAGIIVAGWDPHHGGSVYNIPLGGSLIKQDFAIGGSGSTYITSYCDAHWRPGMTREECKAFVVSSLAHAMERDGSSGGVARTVIIDKNGVERDMVPGNKLPTLELPVFK
jgi:20S proteasome subunit beta 1